MLKKVTILTFCILMIFQSLVAVADVHQPHQDSGEHLEFVHDHDEPTPNTGVSSDTESGFDCHHCGHCHGSCFLGLPQTSMATFDLNSKKFLAAGELYLPSNIPTLLLRPPIA